MIDSNALFSMAGRVALVTGAGTGMGARFARTLAGAGAKVACAARRADKIEAPAEAIRAAGDQAVAVSLDIASSDSVRSAFDAAEKAFGRVDTLINNAGQIVFSPFPQVDDNDWNNLINVNFTGNMRMSREFTNRLLAAKQGGAIVNVTSVTGIRCNAIAPGYFSTDMVDWYFETEQGKAEVERLPSKRVGRVEELDGAVSLLASDAGSFINGVVLPVDAGHSVLLA